MLQAIAFYLFAALVLLSAVFTILARNPVHSVLWLILAFFNAAGLMVIIGAEFIAMLLVIVYVGAVAVLFLFVVMMLDVDFAALRSGVAKYWPFATILAIVLLVRVFHENIERRTHKVDYLGAALLTVSLSLLILAVLEGHVTAGGFELMISCDFAVASEDALIGDFVRAAIVARTWSISWA